MKALSKISNGIRNILFVIAIIILICTVLCFILHIKPGIVVSGSMEPEIGVGSVIFIDTKDKEVEVEDVIAFQREDMLITHRVVEITDEGYITKGDNNETVDISPVLEEELIGTTIYSIPKIGFALRWMSTKAGMIIIATVCICLILVGFITPAKKEDEEDDEEVAE